MIPVLVIAALAIILMFVCILRFPAIQIKGITLDTFYIPVLLAAIILISFPLFDKANLWDTLFTNTPFNPIKILILFICVSMISIALDETGFFGFIASIFINKYKASQKKLFLVLYVLISILTIFTSNDIVILTFTPFILYFSKKGNINPIPYLVMEFVAANTYSMILPIGNPTNIYIASIFSLKFLEYVKYMALPAILCGLTSLLVLLVLFRKELKKPIEVFDMKIEEIKNKPLCIICGIHLALTTIMLVISNYINIEMWIICLSFATSLLLFLIVYSIIKKSKMFLHHTLTLYPHFHHIFQPHYFYIL